MTKQGLQFYFNLYFELTVKNANIANVANS